MDGNEEFLRPEDAARIFKTTTQSLINWANAGKLIVHRTKGGHRRYLKSDILNLSKPQPAPEQSTKESICYCRVSTHSQKQDLERQVEFFRLRYPSHRIVKDIGSGLNFKRKGLKTILDSALLGNLEEVVVTHKDRLCRFGFELVEFIIASKNGKIVVLDQQKSSPEKELVDDILQIITVFSARIHGMRSHSIKKRIKECTDGTDQKENSKDNENTSFSE